MKHEVLIGLAKLLEKQAKLVRDGVEAGEYDLDTVVHLHVSGVLEVGEDTSVVPTHKIPWKTVFALFLHHAGITREGAMDKLVLAMQQALTTGDDAAELLAALAPLEEAESLVQAGLEALPKEPRRGSVVVKDLSCEEVRPARKKAA